jgi:hypothetical protein
MPQDAAAKVSLSFAKLVATPTETAWSQAYNAGNLFVCLSLGLNEPDEELSLQVLGKDLFNVLQSEFFTLPEKNTEHIKNAIRTSLESVPQNVTYSLTLAFFKDTTLLVFIAGSGKITMKREDKAGTLLAKHETDDAVVISASGFVQNTDTIVLETGQFAQGIAQQTVTQALELALPNDIVEALSPQMHKQDNGAQAAIVISFRGASHVMQDAYETDADQTDEQPENQSLDSSPQVGRNDETVETDTYKETETPERFEHRPKVPKFTLPKLPRFIGNFRFNHRRKLYFNIALILALLLILSIFFTAKKYNDDKQKALFQSIYPTAQQYYSEGQGLATVNPSLSQDSYRKAEKLLTDGQTKFSKGSKEQQQIDDLLAKVESGLQSDTTGQSTNATAVNAPSHSLLDVEKSTTNGLAFGQDTQDVYIITDKTISTVSKSDGSPKDIIKNNNYWSSPVAIVPYQGNVYVLDQKKGVLKFVPSSGGFGKTNYFNGAAPDLSNATGMAIDGSIWILLKDGTIMQYTKGKSNGLTVTGLTKQLNKPNKIFTDISMENIYVLDTGNARVVQFDKNGKYQNAFSASAISTAKDFDVSEKDKKALILSGGKIWQISM